MTVVVGPQQSVVALLHPEVLSGTVTICTDQEDDRLVEEFQRRFPRYLPYEGAVLRGRFLTAEGDAPSDWRTLAARFLDEAISVTGSSSMANVFVTWDDADYRCLRMPLSLVRRRLADLLSLPPHMYVLSEDVSWCICFRLEGDMGLSFAKDGPIERRH